MPDYRRAFVPGGTFFFTVVSDRRVPIFNRPLARSLLRAAMDQTARRWPFDVRAMVLLPDHLHAIWTLPEGDVDFSRRWAYLKKTFTQTWLSHGGTEQWCSHSRQKNRRRGVWQRRFWEHALRDECDFAQHCHYIHYNPVKHGLATCPHAWPYSSFHRFVRAGIYDQDWQCVCGGQTIRAMSFAELADTVRE